MTNLLDLPLDQFRGYLAEGNYPQARQDELMRAYRAQNSLAGYLDRYGEEGLEGKNVSTFFPVAGPGGMSIFDALKSGQLQTRFKDYASDALGGVIGALENPKASYDGTLPQADYDGAAMGTGGLAMGGGGVVAAPAGSLRSFAGRNAKTADLDALKMAQELSARKRDPEDIFRQTGWFKGKDGQWRFEIDDSQAEFIGNSRRNALLGDVIKHDELFAAYPELRNVLTATDVRGSQEGSYQPFIDNSGERQRLGVMGEGIRDIDEEIRAFGPTKPAILNTLLHEAGGHALQRREGFAPGSSRGTATDQLLLERNTFLNNLSDKMDARQAELGLSGYRPATNDPELKRLREQYDANVGRALDEDAIYERYYTEAGEVDARNIQLRQDMTPAERRALSPMSTEDVPRSEQRLSGDVVNANASKSAGLLAAGLPDPRNAGEAMAQRILEMRAAGKAGDVTDEMMAQADPQYMFNNTPLDMSEAARMARAQDAGFMDNPETYHGTGDDIQGFRTSFRPDSEGTMSNVGVYSAYTPGLAETYAPFNGGGIIPLATRKTFDDVTVDAPLANWNAISMDSPVTRNGAPVGPLSEALPNAVDSTGAARTNTIAREAVRDGAGSVKFNGIYDVGAFYKDILKDLPPQDVRTDFYPHNIRSRFARFDPEFSHLSNLSAANASAPVGLLAAQPSTEDELRQYLMQRGLLQ